MQNIPNTKRYIMKDLFLFALLTVLLIGCKKDHGTTGIIIKGTTSESSNKTGDSHSGAAANSLDDVRKVLVFDIHIGSFISRFVDITDGAFSYTSSLGVATTLVFLDEQNRFIGTFSDQGLNLLPIFNLTDGDNTVIDLSTLTLNGSSVIPSHDPLGNEIIISQEEIDRLDLVSGYFETMAKNIDTDNDSILDVLNNRQLYMKTRFNFLGGQWGLNGTAPVFSKSLSGYQVEVDGGSGFSHPGNIVLSGPATNPYPDINLNANNPDGNGGFYAVFGRQSFSPFESGTYSLSIDGSNHTLDYTFIDPEVNLVFVLPTLHTNTEGKLVSISLEYRQSDNTPIDPINILTDVMVQFTNTSDIQFYDTPRLINESVTLEGCNCIKGLYSYTLDTPLDITQLRDVTVSYNDLLGNNYFIRWNE
jgi:hypothetical protein